MIDIYSRVLTEKLCPLPGFPECLATESIANEGITGLGDQFRSEALVYDERYFDVDSKKAVITDVLRRLSARVSDAPAILDVACGSGNATFAALEIFPNSTVYATDLSPELISILMARARRVGVEKKIAPFVSNAADVKLRKGSFDLVFGSSMLHHLVDPASFADRILQALKPGGVAVFLEPFKSGHLYLRELLATMVRLSEFKGGISDQQVKFMRDYIFTIEFVSNEDRTRPALKDLDDKWMFAKSFFDEIARKNRCEHVIFSTNPAQHPFKHKVLDLMEKGLGSTFSVPDWANEILDQADAAMGTDTRDELLCEGCVAFVRS